jgi:hypothetical protein
MAGLLETIVILWKSIHRSLESNKEAKVYTINKFASVLPEYLKVFKVSCFLACTAPRGMSRVSTQLLCHSARGAGVELM